MATPFNRIVLLAVFSLLLLSSAAKAQSLAWAQAIVGSGSAGVGTVATDTAGNLYSVGSFSGTADFDRGTGVYNLTAVSRYFDMFIMKEDASGNLIWVKQVKGLSSGVWGSGGRGYIDSAGNIFVIGTFRDSVDFDPGPAVYKLNSYGGYHAFVLKLDSAGNFVWVKDIGTQVPAVGVSATATGRDKNGGYLYFAALVSGDGITPVDADPSSAVYNVTPSRGDILLEKLDSNGNFIWAKLVTGDDIKTPRSLAFDSVSNIFVSGYFFGSADFDPSPSVYTLTCTPAGGNMTDFFVAKYDSAGNFSWAHSFGSNSDDKASGGAVDRFGNVLIAGHFGDTVDFDPGPNVYNLTSVSTRSIFTLKLRNNGEFVWVRMAGGGGLNEGRAIATDDTGNVYTAATLGGSYVTVQKFDSAGNDVWVAGLEGDAPGWIGLDNKDSIYITGSFTGANRDFDPGPGVYPLSGAGGSAGFIVKLNQTLLPTGINEASLQTAAVSVYPNPSSSIITFSSPVAIHLIEVTDIMGKVVYWAEPGSVKTEINLGGKAAGVYFYEVDCGAGKQRGKLVVY